MKKHYLFLTTLLVVAAVSVAVVSCKKETQGNLMNNKNESVQTFNPREIEDMNAYLKGFKQKMQSATKSDNEAFSLEDAAWHLSSLANYEFANANVECDDIRFDTLYAQVNITNGAVLLSDLGTAYEKINSSINKFYNSLTLYNKHFRFINAFISENGEVTIPILTTFSNNSKYITNHCWFFSDEFAAADSCALFFPDSPYPVQTTGTSELLYMLSMTVSHPYLLVSYPMPSSGVYYTYASTKPFDYRYYTDPYWSPFWNSSRVFSSKNTYNYYLEQDEMCYLYDSYMGLGIEHCPNGQEIVSWNLAYHQPVSPWNVEYHVFEVIYGIRHDHSPGIGHEND